MEGNFITGESERVNQMDAMCTGAGYAPAYPRRELVWLLANCVEASREGISYSWFLCGGALAHDTRSGGVCGCGTFGSPM